MSKTILFTFENIAERNEFLSQIRSFAASRLADGDKLITNVLNTIRLDPQVKSDTERSAALFVSGKKLVEGPLADMQRRFEQEAAAHSASVEVRELRDGEWTVIRSRKLQKQ